MALKIMPHGRLQEWVADEKGFFTAEGLEYSFLVEDDYGIHSVHRDDSGEIKTGAFETFEAGRDGADVSCACHWATNAAASERAGQLVTAAYSVAPCAIMVPPESPVRRPEDLAGVPVGVGYHSGSHFATLQALEAVLPADQVSLSFQGPPNERLDALLDRQVPAGTMWGVPLYIAEAQPVPRPAVRSGQLRRGRPGLKRWPDNGAQPAMVFLSCRGGPVVNVSPVKASKNKMTNPP